MSQDERIKRHRGRPPLQVGETSTPICVRVPNNVYDEATRRVKSDRVSMSELVRRALSHVLKDERGRVIL